MSLAGKTALVTGGGRGIGRAVAGRLAREGAHVLVAGRTASDLAEVARAIEGEPIELDVANRSSVAAFVESIGADGRRRRIDIVVNNAGAAESAPLERTSDELCDRMLAVNVTGAFTLCRALVPPMVASGWGRVVNIASNAGLTGYAYSAAYCASKHALVGLTRALALEVARSGVTVNAVCPGWVTTRLVDEAVDRIATKTGRSIDEARRSLESMSPQRRMVEPNEVAELVAMLCQETARPIHGQAIAIDGGQVMS